MPPSRSARFEVAASGNQHMADAVRGMHGLCVSARVRPGRPTVGFARTVPRVRRRTRPSGAERPLRADVRQPHRTRSSR
jgi:hypothetical protein